MDTSAKQSAAAWLTGPAGAQGPPPGQSQQQPMQANAQPYIPGQHQGQYQPPSQGQYQSNPYGQGKGDHNPWSQSPGQQADTYSFAGSQASPQGQYPGGNQSPYRDQPWETQSNATSHGQSPGNTQTQPWQQNAHPGATQAAWGPPSIPEGQPYTGGMPQSQSHPPYHPGNDSMPHGPSPGYGGQPQGQSGTHDPNTHSWGGPAPGHPQHQSSPMGQQPQYQQWGGGQYAQRSAMGDQPQGMSHAGSLAGSMGASQMQPQGVSFGMTSSQAMQSPSQTSQPQSGPGRDPNDPELTTAYTQLVAETKKLLGDGALHMRQLTPSQPVTGPNGNNFTVGEILTEINSALSQGPEILMQRVLTMAPNMRYVRTPYPEFMTIISQAENIKRMQSKPKSQATKTVKAVMHVAGEATTLSNGEEGIKRAYALPEGLREGVVLISGEREGGSGKTGMQGGSLAFYVDIGIEYHSAGRFVGTSGCIFLTNLIVNTPQGKAHEYDGFSDTRIEGQHYVRAGSASLSPVIEGVLAAHPKYNPIKGQLLRSQRDPKIVATTLGLDNVTVFTAQGGAFIPYPAGLASALAEVGGDSPTVMCMATLRVRLQSDAIVDAARQRNMAQRKPDPNGWKLGGQIVTIIVLSGCNEPKFSVNSGGGIDVGELDASQATNVANVNSALAGSPTGGYQSMGSHSWGASPGGYGPPTNTW